MTRTGPELALLLLEGFRSLVDRTVQELDHRGFSDVRPAYEFAMRAIAGGADSTSELARQLSVTKQGAAKTVAVLVERGWLVQAADAADARRQRLLLTDTGRTILATGEQIMTGLRKQWAKQVGPRELSKLEDLLAELVGETGVRFDSSSWMTRHT